MKPMLIVLMTLLIAACSGSDSSQTLKTTRAPSAQSAMIADDFSVLSPIPQDIVSDHNLDTAYYKKVIMVWGNPILGSEKISEQVLKNAAEVTAKMLSDEVLNPAQATNIRNDLVAHRFKVVIYPTSSELGTKEVPEFSQFATEDGYGATKDIPILAVSELNANFELHTNKQGNSLVHEILHSIHLLSVVDRLPNFNTELKQAYDNAITQEIWEPTTYIARANEYEYLAEGAELFFEFNTTYIKLNRADFANKDPMLYDLLAQLFITEGNALAQLSFIPPLVTVNASISYDTITQLNTDESITNQQFVYALDNYQMSILADGRPLQVSFLDYEPYNDVFLNTLMRIDVNRDPVTFVYQLPHPDYAINSFFAEIYTLTLHYNDNLLLSCDLPSTLVKVLGNSDEALALDNALHLCQFDYR